MGGAFKKKEEFHTGVHNLIMIRIWSLEIFLRLLPPRLGRVIPGILVKMHLYIDTDSGLSVNVKSKKDKRLSPDYI